MVPRVPPPPLHPRRASDGPLVVQEPTAQESKGEEGTARVYSVRHAAVRARTRDGMHEGAGTAKGSRVRASAGSRSGAGGQQGGTAGCMCRGSRNHTHRTCSARITLDTRALTEPSVPPLCRNSPTVIRRAVSPAAKFSHSTRSKMARAPLGPQLVIAAAEEFKVPPNEFNLPTYYATPSGYARLVECNRARTYFNSNVLLHVFDHRGFWERRLQLHMLRDEILRQLLVPITTEAGLAAERTRARESRARERARTTPAAELRPLPPGPPQEEEAKQSVPSRPASSGLRE